MALDSILLQRLCRARQVLQETQEPLRIDEIARDVGMSPFHFIRRFEALFGLTPHQLRIRARMERAKQLLASGHWSVTDACMEVGFSSLGSFSVAFRRYTGETPSTYRRRLRPMVVVPGTISSVLVPGCLALMQFLPTATLSNFREARPPHPLAQ